MAAPSQPATSAKNAKAGAGLRSIQAGRALEAALAERLLPVYLVTSGELEERGRNEERPGADPQALLATARVIEQAALRGGDPSLDHVKIDYLDGDHQGTGIHAIVAHEARSVSLFGGRRVITVVHADKLTFAGSGEDEGAKKGRKSKKPVGDDPLEKLVEGLDPESTRPPFVLIFVAEHFDRRKKAYKALQAAGAVVEVPPMTVATLQAWLEGEGTAFGIRVERTVAQKIWDRLGGGDAARLRQTADRLLLDAGPGGTVTLAMVEATVPMDRDAAMWAITDAVADEDVTRALAVLHMMLEHATPSEREGEVIKIVGFLNSQYTAMLRVASGWARGKNDAQVAEELGMHPYRLRNIGIQLRRMRPGRLELALASVDAIDQVLKSTALGERKAATMRWLEQLVLALARGEPLRLKGTPPLLESL